jgi:hypothetical protein
MNWSDNFKDLRFDRRIITFPGRLIFTFIILVIFTICWHILPRILMYWFWFFALGIITWVASYGWHNALGALINFLHLLDQL